MLEVAHEPRLVNRLHRAESHGYRRELPEIGHQPGVRVGRQALAGHLLAEMPQLLLAQSSLEVGARVDPGTRVALHEDQVAGMAVARRAPEVVETHLIQRGRGRVGGDVPAVLRIRAIRVDHHGHRVPADVCLDPAFQCPVPRVRLLIGDRNRIQVGRVRLVGQVRAGTARMVDQPLQQEMRALRSVDLQDGVDRFQPFLGLDGIDVVHFAALDHESGSAVSCRPTGTPDRGADERSRSCQPDSPSALGTGFMFTAGQDSALRGTAREASTI